MFTLSVFTIAVSTLLSKTVWASPVITPAPALDLPPVLPTGAVSTIDIGQCLATLQCCQSTQTNEPTPTSLVGGLLSLVGLSAQGAEVPVGVTCSPISVSCSSFLVIVAQF